MDLNFSWMGDARLSTNLRYFILQFAIRISKIRISAFRGIPSFYKLMSLRC